MKQEVAHTAHMGQALLQWLPASTHPPSLLRQHARTWDPDEECEKAVYEEVLVAADFQEHSQWRQEHGRNEPAQRSCESPTLGVR